MDAQTLDAYAEVTDDGLHEAIDHARTNAARKPTSPAYRDWWEARARHLEAVLAERTKGEQS